MSARMCTLLAAVADAGSSIDAVAQSCAMCYTSAAASKGGGISALQHGILILLIPPLLIFTGICVAAFRRPNKFDFKGSSPAAQGHIPAGRENQ